MLQRLNNPTQLPMGVVEGYQAQNTQVFAARVGLDTTAPFDDGATITVPAGGVVEDNGVMYRIASQFSRAKPNSNTAYWIVVVPSPDGSAASLDLVTRPGVWNHARNGCYFTSGAHNGGRTLNWVSRGALADVPADGTAVVARTNKTGNEQISLRKGWHFVRLGSGLGGGNGGSGHAGEQGGWSGGRGGNGAWPGGGGKDSGNMGNTGSGGAGGQAGLWRTAGIPGGFCRIFLLGN